ncbi:hypothetical protein ACJMK2_041739 [Sinanodonta woodiana]|uniref:HAT C-terminal dimerisation domain-containing protein n=1 Tax=Sinanodonta woodiana TaxID=1069815 RepID=A0ABD3W547_SINWO
MADVKVNAQVEPVTSDEQPSDSLPPQRIAPSILNVRDDNTKTVVTLCPPNTKAKINPITDVIHQEDSRYLLAAPYDTNLTMLHWRKQNCQFYPHLSLLAKKYLSIPASSVSSERVFSLAGHLVSKKQAHLSCDNVDLIIFLNNNINYW